MKKSLFPLLAGALLTIGGACVRQQKDASEKQASNITPCLVPQTIDVNPRASEAVILFVGAENQQDADSSGGQQFRLDYCLHVASKVEKLQKSFKRQGIPCYVIGDPVYGFTMKQAQQDIARLINRYNYRAVTGLALCHGNVRGYQKPSECTPEEIEERLLSDTVYHSLQIAYDGLGRKPVNYTSMRAGDFFQGFSADSLIKEGAKKGLEKMDWVLGTCYSGSTKQKEADKLPKGSVVIALSAPNEQGFQLTCHLMASDLDSTHADHGADALDILRGTLYHSTQVGENDALVYISGRKEKISLNKRAALFYTRSNPFDFIAANKNFVDERLAAHRSRMAEDFYETLELSEGKSYEDYEKNDRPILQGFTLDKTIIFTGEPGRPVRYRGLNIK